MLAVRLCVCASVPAVLAACGQPRDPVAQVSQAADSADQLMIGMRLYLTNEGVRQAYLEADSAFVYENSGRTELKGVKVTFFRTATGDPASVLTANEGTYRGRTGAMEARGNCVVVRNDGARLTSSVLRYDQTANQVSTDQPYTWDEAGRHVEGVGFTSDPTFSNIDTRRLRGTAGGFTLPGQ